MIIKCKICKKEVEGRTDRKFCSATCKNYCHIHLRHASKQAAISINEYLIPIAIGRNHGILLEQLGKNKSQVKVYRNILEDKKFRFKYHTHSQINSKGKIFNYIYDLAWMVPIPIGIVMMRYS